jgi:hypothetical protein
MSKDLPLELKKVLRKIESEICSEESDARHSILHYFSVVDGFCHENCCLTGYECRVRKKSLCDYLDLKRVPKVLKLKR